MTGVTPETAELSLGPVLFNWAPEAWRDFYFRIADEAPVATVLVGETVCSKRAPFLAPHLPVVIERLEAAGKVVVLASPALVTTDPERRAVRELAETDGHWIEANDIGLLGLIAGRPHVIGPMVNVYNESTLSWLAGRGAKRVCLPAEISGASIAALAPGAARLGVELEVQVFGRQPLAISARCYHARAHGLHKDGCQFICAQDPDGMKVTTLDGDSFLSVNGTQTLSHTFVALVAELAPLRAAGVRQFRLSPHTLDMVAVARLFRDRLDGRRDDAEVLEALAALAGEHALSNGFYHGREGHSFARAEA